jgi:hypothetical protein
MKKMTFLFILPLFFGTALALCKKDEIAGAPQPRRAYNKQRIDLQARLMRPQNLSRSPSPRPNRRINQQIPRRNRVPSMNQRG